MLRRLTPAQLAIDLSLAAVCVLLRVAVGSLTPPLVFLLVAMGVALALRRLSPGLALAVAWVGAIVQMATLTAPDVANLAIFAILYATARYGSRAIRWIGLASAEVGAAVAAAYLILGLGVGSIPADEVNWDDIARVSLIGFPSALAVFGLSWTLGLLARTWANARENRRARILAERSVVVEQERNRIARDMHDVVAHSLAVVIAQADGARYAQGIETKDAALATISATSRAALADVRLLLGQLRHSEEAGPQPALADLEALVEQLRGSGLIVSLDQRGEPAALPAAKQLAIYRITQEALTNALRHGDTGAAVDALIEWTPDAATLTVSNARATEAEVGADGHGVPGMRERAVLAGGTVEAAPEGDRFVVRARIPVSS